jgi:hypothetical protein
MAGRHTCLLLVDEQAKLLMGNFHLPGQKCHQKSRPREEKSPTIFVEGVQDRNRACFAVDGIHLRGFPQVRRLERHNCDELPVVLLLKLVKED